MNSDPPLKTYPFLSNYLGVLMANGHDITGILWNNFIELFYSPGSGEVGFRRLKYLKKLFSCEPFSIPETGILSFVRQNIEFGRYVTIILNAQFLLEKKTREPYYHDCMFYGFDDGKKALKAISYFDGIYQAFDLNYATFLASIPEKNAVTGFEKNFMNNHVFYIASDFIPEKPDIKKIKKRLRKYVYGLPPYFFNLHALTRFRIYLEKNSDSHWINLRSLRSIYEQKYVIYQIVKQYSHRQEIVEDYKKTVQLSEAMLRLGTKYFLIYKESDLKRIGSLLHDITRQDRRLILEFLREIS